MDQKQQVFSKQLQSSEAKEKKAQCFVMIATSNKVVKIYSEAGTKVQEDEFDSVVTKITTIQRNSLGELLLSRLATIGCADNFVDGYWVGFEDGYLGYRSCTF